MENRIRHAAIDAVATPEPFARQSFTEAADAVTALQALYERNTAFLRDSFAALAGGGEKQQRYRAFYPEITIATASFAQVDSRLAYGHVPEPGRYSTTITRPDLFESYLTEQLRLLIRNHSVPVTVGESETPIPLHFAFQEGSYVEATVAQRIRRPLRDMFDVPDLNNTDDHIVNGTYEPVPGEPMPLAGFTAQRIDYSLHRLSHYTATSPHHFQNYVLFTNYQFYIDEFIKLGRAEMARPDSDYIAFVEPGNVITRRAGLDAEPVDALGVVPPRLPQMPAYHLLRADRSGITMVNIGVGPANAKTITDHIAVLRPHAWMMLGHCAGLRTSQQLGDYVLAHAYVREDHVLDEELPLWVPIPALAEIQVALEGAVAEVTGLAPHELKRIMRTGTVASTDNRNWELLPTRNMPSTPQRRFSQSRAVALDMESATIAANGFRFRVPYGTLLCVSDKPLHGEIKLPGMANHFYRERVDQHLRIGIRAIERLRAGGIDQLHSRKLRSFAEVAFQ